MAKRKYEPNSIGILLKKCRLRLKAVLHFPLNILCKGNSVMGEVSSNMSLRKVITNTCKNYQVDFGFIELMFFVDIIAL